jgi:hypothetical protein
MALILSEAQNLYRSLLFVIPERSEEYPHFAYAAESILSPAH